MKFLILSDMHGDFEKLDRLDEKFREADAVIFGGDFSKFKSPETGLPAMEALCKKHDVIFSVIGNCDEPNLLIESEARDINVEGSLVNHEGLFFAGSGGGTKFTGETPFERTEEELLSDLKIISDGEDGDWNNLILIVHNPPKDTGCDKIKSGIHVGSQEIRDFIEKYRPLAVVTGHIHESAAVDKIGDSVIMNPGALFEGRYGWLEVESSNGKWEVKKSELLEL
ncbi:MAG: metallophosphoesterase [Treponema sp.]|nr:metallophosphoesterase [Treponema sp.]